METTVNEIDYNLVANIDNHERFLYLYHKDFKKITGFSIKDAYLQNKTELIEGFLVITNMDGKKIYRRYRGCHVNSDKVYLGYRSMCELGLNDGDKIFVEPTSWLKYFLNNSDTYVRTTVKIAIFGLACTVLSTLVSFIALLK